VNAPWLAIVGIGEDGMDGLSPAARTLIDQAETLIGGPRHLALIPEDGKERLPWPRPLASLPSVLLERHGRTVCVLASGDPYCFGIGTMIARTVPVAETICVPAPSAFSLARARLGWGTNETVELSLHEGKPTTILNAHLAPGARLLILSRDRTSPAVVARHLARAGWGASKLLVLSRMGGPAESRIERTAATWDGFEPEDLNTIAVECVADAGVSPRSTAPGLPDAAYDHDGLITKREVRAATLAALAPLPGELLWDVGAGSGSIAIEWTRVHTTNRAIAIERDLERLRRIADNTGKLGGEIRLIAGEAPFALLGLEAPDAVFLGGGTADREIADVCVAALKPGGRLVANAVTVEGERTLFELRDTLGGGEMVRLSVERLEPLGEGFGWKPARTVTQFRWTKGGA